MLRSSNRPSPRFEPPPPRRRTKRKTTALAALPNASCFEFLESLPETAGRFELNATLDFQFGPRPAEVDLLCRSPRIAIELDGYFHFLAPDGYRRDRTKDWELQRRGFVVLRFLAEDVIPQLEMIRDRILDAITVTPTWSTTLDHCSRHTARHRRRRPRAGSDGLAEQEASRSVRGAEGRR